MEERRGVPAGADGLGHSDSRRAAAARALHLSTGRREQPADPHHRRAAQLRDRSRIDRIGPELHPKSGFAKDVGSAAVLFAIANTVLVWCALLWNAIF